MKELFILSRDLFVDGSAIRSCLN